MNEQYSDSWLRRGLRNPDHTEDPITDPAWIRRHRHRQRQNKQSKRQRDSQRDKHHRVLFYQGVSKSKQESKIHRIYFKINQLLKTRERVTHR